MANHTPGPWRLGSEATIEDAAGQPFAGAFWDDDDIDVDTAEANARLMAAAPDLLTALRQVERALLTDSRQKTIFRDTVEYHLDGNTMYHAINTARDAIAKAERV